VTEGTVRLQRCGALGRLLLDRPAKRNALSTHMLGELGDRLLQITDDPELRVVVVHGEGPVFCAGADVGEFSSVTAEAVRGRWTRLGQRVFTALAELPQTTVAVLTGGAFGGGLELAMHCDFRVASSDAVVALPEVTLGTAPGWSGLGRIVELIGVGPARLLALTGRRLPASDALRLGLVDVVADDVTAALDELVAQLLGTDPIAQTIIKRALSNRHPSASLIDSLAGAYLAQTGRT
jgi:enoyl-CoA hydratase/carnithine racemase